MRAVDVVVVGGGVAGLSAAVHLAREHEVLLLEREPVLAAHASGRNAAIYRPLELDLTTAQLCRRSLALLDSWMDAPVLERSGLLLVAADAQALQRLHAHARQHAISVELLDHEGVRAHAPLLAQGDVTCGLWVPDGGVLDIHALTSALARVARQRGAQLRTATQVSRVERQGDRVRGVVLGDGARVATSAVVFASGAWNVLLGRALDAALPLRPLRRHLVQLDTDAAPAAGPVLWRVDAHEAYLRPESEGLLASPCDEELFEACDPPAVPGALETLSTKLARMSPPLAAARVRRSWACLRTFAPDRELVIGPDPRVQGLYWLTGFGGRGMGVAVAAGELLADSMAGARFELEHAVAPARLLGA